MCQKIPALLLQHAVSPGWKAFPQTFQNGLLALKSPLTRRLLEYDFSNYPNHYYSMSCTVLLRTWNFLCSCLLSAPHGKVSCITPAVPRSSRRVPGTMRNKKDKDKHYVINKHLSIWFKKYIYIYMTDIYWYIYIHIFFSFPCCQIHSWWKQC